MPLNKKNILIPGVLAGFAWIGIVAMIVVLKPEGLATLLFFFILLFAATYLTAMTALSCKRRATLIACLIISLLLLKYFRLDAIINVILTIALFVTIEVYFMSNKSPQKQ